MHLTRRAQHLIMGRKGPTHRIGVGLPTTRSTLNIREHERHCPRRSCHDRRRRQQQRPL